LVVTTTTTILQTAKTFPGSQQLYLVLRTFAVKPVLLPHASFLLTALFSAC